MARRLLGTGSLLLLLACGTQPVDEPPPDDVRDDAGVSEGDPGDGDGEHGDGDGGDGDRGDGDVGDGDAGDGDTGDGDAGDGDAGDGDASDGGDAGTNPDDGLLPEPPETSVPSQGSARRLDVGSWNIEWFGDPNEGPSDEQRQADNAREILLGSAMDIWGVAEVVDASAFHALVESMPGYQVLLADDALVVGGAANYSAGEQKVGLVYREDIVTVRSAKIALGDQDYAFAGRPPLEAHLDVTIAGQTRPLVVLVLHAKALSDADAWQRRSEGAAALKSYLDSAYPDESVLVVGDFNDVLEGSISPGEESPYRAFVQDTSDYFFISSELASGSGSTVGHNTVIDHHLVTDELRPRYVEGSVQIYRVDKFVQAYGSTTSDHYPVISHYEW